MAFTRDTVTIPQPKFDDATLRDIGSFQDALALLALNEIDAESIEEYGTGFTVLKTADKARLVGVPLILIEWTFNKSSYGEAPFVSLMAVTKSSEKVIINDGSTGIAKQLLDITNERVSRGHRHPQMGLAVPNGLSVSEYKWVDPSDGKEKPATTFYLAE